MPEVITYKDSSGTIYDVPSEQVQAFLQVKPDAQEVQSFVFGSDTFDVPIESITEFIAQMPNAKPLFEKQEVQTSSGQGRLSSATNQLFKSIVDIAGSLVKDIAIISKKINIGGEYDNVPLEELSTFKAGKWIQDTSADLFKTNPEYEEEFITSVLPQAFGSAAAFVGGGIASRSVKGIGWLTASLIGGMSMGADEYENALAKGSNEGDATMTWLINHALGAVEGIPIGRTFSRWNKWTKGGWVDVLKKSGVGGLEEMVQESLQGIGQNITAKEYYDEARELWDGVNQGGAAGFITGFMLNALGLSRVKIKLSGMSEAEKAVSIAYMNEGDKLIEKGKEQVNNLPSIQDAQRDYQQKVEQRQFIEMGLEAEQEEFQQEIDEDILAREQAERELSPEEIFSDELGLEFDEKVQLAEDKAESDLSVSDEMFDKVLEIDNVIDSEGDPGLKKDLDYIDKDTEDKKIEITTIEGKETLTIKQAKERLEYLRNPELADGLDANEMILADDEARAIEKALGSNIETEKEFGKDIKEFDPNDPTLVREEDIESEIPQKPSQIKSDQEILDRESKTIPKTEKSLKIESKKDLEELEQKVDNFAKSIDVSQPTTANLQMKEFIKSFTEKELKHVADYSDSKIAELKKGEKTEKTIEKYMPFVSIKDFATQIIGAPGKAIEHKMVKELGFKIQTSPETDLHNGKEKGDISGMEESESTETNVTGNFAINKMIDAGVVEEKNKDKVYNKISKLSKNNDAKKFKKEIDAEFKDHNLTDEEIWKLHRTERETESTEVFDMDFVEDEQGNVSMKMNKSSFINHRRMRTNDKYLINDVLRPFKNKIAVLTMFNSKIWGLNSTSKFKDIMPFNRRNSVKVRDLDFGKILKIKEMLNRKGYFLYPMSDSDTILIGKIDQKYIGKKESNLKDLIKRYPSNATAYNKYTNIQLAAEISFDDAMKNMLGLWYDGNMSSNDVNKRFKLFLPKGTPLDFHRKIKVNIVDDIVYGTLEATDGNTLMNPKFAKEFNEYNKLGDAKQLKTIITKSTDEHLVAIKHMSHVATPLEWKKLTELTGTNPDVDIIVFKTSAKIVKNQEGSDIEGEMELDASSFRHIFTGKEHDFATLTRQIFNFVEDPEVRKYLMEDVVDKIANNVNDDYIDFEQNPRRLLKYLKSVMGDTENFELSDFRRYIRLDAFLFKSLRDNIKSFLKNDYIVNKFIKMRQEGNFPYLKPDYFNEVKEGEIFVPGSELERIAGTLKIDIGNMSKDEARRLVNKKLESSVVEVLTFRPPVPRIDNIQVLKIKKILDTDHGNAAIMNTEDAILNKESDWDGDEVFFHYSDNNVNLEKLFKYIKSQTKEVKPIELVTTSTGKSSMFMNRIDSAAKAALGKKAIGETAKAIMVKSILQQNNVKIGVIGEDSYIIKDGDVSQYDKIHELKKDLTEWDDKIAYTTQSAVDNLKTNSMTASSVWQVKDTGHGFTVDYNRQMMYADLFEGGISGKLVNQALKPLQDGLEVFSKDFENDASWSQDTINETAKKYQLFIENNGSMGNSPQEEMVIKMANMGYLVGKKMKEGYDSDHDNAHRGAVKYFFSKYIKNIPENLLVKAKKNEIKKNVIAFYKAKKNVDSDIEQKRSEGIPVSEDANYDDLYSKYIEYAEKLNETEKDYFDWVVLHGFVIDENGEIKMENGEPKYNSSFGLRLISDKNIKEFSSGKGMFNEKFYGYRLNKQSGYIFLGNSKKNDSRKHYDSNANTFNKIYNGIEYDVDTDKDLAEIIKTMDKINKERYKIADLNFSDKINLKLLYSYVLGNKGKTLEDKLSKEDVRDILMEIKRVRIDLSNSNINPIKRYFFFTFDILKNNPYTKKHLGKLQEYSEGKDSDSQGFMSQISRTGKGAKGAREKLDLLGKGRMHQAEQIMNLYNQKKIAELTQDEKMLKKVNKKIDKLLVNQEIKKQAEVLFDVVDALNGVISEAELKKKYGQDVYDGFQGIRALLDEIYLYDVSTYNNRIGSASDPNSWQGKQISKLRKDLSGRKYTKENIEAIARVEAKEIIRKAIPGTGIKLIINKSPEFNKAYDKHKHLIGKTYTTSTIEHIIKTVVISPPQNRKNYYPHMYFDYELDEIAKYRILENIDGVDTSDLLERVKGLNFWKTRTKDGTKQEKYVDRNIFTVLTRRVNASINARWTNSFRSLMHDIVADLDVGIKKELSEKNIEALKTLIHLKGVVDAMSKDVQSIPEFSWVKSASNILRNLYLSNLLLFSTRGILRNLSQGIVPNLIEFGATVFKKGYDFRKNGRSSRFKGEELGGKPGEIVLTDEVDLDGKPIVKSVFKDMGLARADIFAKVEGGQEWDIYSMMHRVEDINKMVNQGDLSSKTKFYLKDWLTRTENAMNSYTKKIGENNIFTLMFSRGGVVRTTPVRALNKLLPDKLKLAVPELGTSKVSFSQIEYWNREMSASMSFTKHWDELVDAGAERNELTYKRALKKARQSVDDIQYNYNMWNRPRALRKFPTVFQFKSFLLGTLKLHWKWIKDLTTDPKKNMHKAIYFAAIMLITSMLEKWTKLGWFRFFEIPEKEYLEDLSDALFGNRKEREWAFYGNRLSPLTGPAGGMALEAMFAAGLWDTSTARKRNAYYRLVESHIPAVKELNQIYAMGYRSYGNPRMMFNDAAAYLGLYPIYDKPKRLTGLDSGFKTKRYQGPLRQILSGRHRIFSN